MEPRLGQLPLPPLMHWRTFAPGNRTRGRGAVTIWPDRIDSWGSRLWSTQPSISDAIPVRSITSVSTDGGALLVHCTGHTARLPAPPILSAADWYPDPAGEAPLRWWDGSRWTEQLGIYED